MKFDEVVLMPAMLVSDVQCVRQASSHMSHLYHTNQPKVFKGVYVNAIMADLHFP